MYNFSPIKAMTIKNFRNIGEITLDFTESPILALIGDNEAGKTSVVKAFGVGAAHLNGKDQKRFIREGTNGFGIAIQLEDGTLVVRMKTPTVNKYQVKYTNGEIWDTSKIDAGLPVQVSEVMGIIEEPETKEFLQIRTYEDQLLFVVTPASTNYKVMYDALKVDQLTRAIKAGSQEANSYKSEINESEIAIRTLTDNLKGIRVMDIESLVKIRNRLIEQTKLFEKIERAESINRTIGILYKQLGSIKLLSENGLTIINEARANKFNTIYNFLCKIDRLNKCVLMYGELETLKHIDTSIASKIKDTYNRKLAMQNAIRASKLYLEINQASAVREDILQKFIRIMQIMTHVSNENKRLKIIDIKECNEITAVDIEAVNKMVKIAGLANRISLLETAKRQCDDYTESVSNYLRQLGIATSTCTKCGETVIFNLESLEKRRES